MLLSIYVIYYEENVILLWFLFQSFLLLFQLSFVKSANVEFTFDFSPKKTLYEVLYWLAKDGELYFFG